MDRIVARSGAINVKSSVQRTCAHAQKISYQSFRPRKSRQTFHALELCIKTRNRVIPRSSSSESNDTKPQDSSIEETKSDPQIGNRHTQPPSTTSSPSSDTPTTASKQPPSSITWQGLFKLCFNKVKTNLWPLLLVHMICDAFVFCLHRSSHRLTNQLAVSMLNNPLVTPSTIGNMWWLTSDPSIANFQSGYQTLSILVFLLAFPLNIFLKSLASSATIIICQNDVGTNLPQHISWWRPLLGVRHALSAVRSHVWQHVAALWKPVFLVELIVSAAVIPLQFASLAVVTLPLTLPIILSLYAATPVVVLEQKRGLEAIQRSRNLLSPIKWMVAVPFLGFVVAQRILESLKGQVLSYVPARFYKELVEVPIAILIGGVLLSVLLARMQEVLPFVAFTEGKRKEEENAALTIAAPTTTAT